MTDIQQEVKNYSNAREREQVDNEADVFALVQTIQMLEKAYIKDAVTSQEYTAACSKQLVQFKAAFKLISHEYHNQIEMFTKKYNLDCPAALERIREDRPITIKNDSGNQSKVIANVVSLFITMSDRLKLNMRAMDELHPDLKELYETLLTMSTLSNEHNTIVKVKKWLDKLDTMSVHDELSEEEAREMIFEMDSAHSEFIKVLQ